MTREASQCCVNETAKQVLLSLNGKATEKESEEPGKYSGKNNL